MEHIEEAGVHSGDSACVIPPFTLGDAKVAEIRAITTRLARALGVRGLMNVQYAVRLGEVYVLEANPRASRTVPFVSKAVGLPLARLAARVMVGERLADIRPAETEPTMISVKKPVLPFSRFPGEDALLGPEMKSTGEVMGRDLDFGRALAKAHLGAGEALPDSGNVLISVRDDDKRAITFMAKKLVELGMDWWPPAARPGSSPAMASPSARSSRCTRVVRTWPTSSTTARSRWSSTRRSVARRSMTSRPSASVRWP
jgi:carbamoyl-phosphate synthase large subunit